MTTYRYYAWFSAKHKNQWIKDEADKLYYSFTDSDGSEIKNYVKYTPKYLTSPSGEQIEYTAISPTEDHGYVWDDMVHVGFVNL
jgi:hypothetical protein